MRLSLAGRSHRGRVRSENQDRLLAVSLGDPADGPGVFLEGGEGVRDRPGTVETEVGDMGLLLMVADGMGGAKGGALASRLAAESVRNFLARNWPQATRHDPATLASFIGLAIDHANSVIHARVADEPAHARMGTTATVVGVLEEKLCIGQVGDSRAYLRRAGSLRQLTRDQSLIQRKVDSGEVTAEEAEDAPGSNVLLQALGVEPFLKVELTTEEAEPGDVVLLCSDGLFRELKKDDMELVLASNPELDQACQTLLQLALDRGAKDNVTVLLGRVEPAP